MLQGKLVAGNRHARNLHAGPIDDNVRAASVGERSGAIDAMLGKVADWYEQEVDDAVEALTSLLEPAIMAFLGVVIGGIVIGMYLPIFKMGAVV